MKKVAFLTVFISVFAFCNAQNHYYWSGGKKIWLDTDSSKMIVEFDNEQDIRAFAFTVIYAKNITDTKIFHIFAASISSKSNDGRSLSVA